MIDEFYSTVFTENNDNYIYTWLGSKRVQGRWIVFRTLFILGIACLNYNENFGYLQHIGQGQTELQATVPHPVPNYFNLNRSLNGNGQINFCKRKQYSIEKLVSTKRNNYAFTALMFE